MTGDEGEWDGGSSVYGCVDAQCCYLKPGLGNSMLCVGLHNASMAIVRAPEQPLVMMTSAGVKLLTLTNETVAGDQCDGYEYRVATACRAGNEPVDGAYPL